MKSIANPNLWRSSLRQIENLLLDGDVKRRRRLVGNQQLRRLTMAMAIITRCRMPPESWCG